MKMKNISLLTFLFILPIYCWSQTTTFQVVTKTMKEINTWNPKQTLEINGENAIIHISTWDQEKIQTTVELIAKHPEKKIAEEDIEVLKYSITSQRKLITINNYLSISEKQSKPTSTLKTKLTILVPPTCPLVIKNNFGSIYIKGLQERLEIDSRFTKISIENIQGEFNLNSHLGEIKGKSILANTKITSNRSDIYFEKLAGDISMKAHYGTIQILEDPAYTYNLDLKGNKSNVTILNTNADLNTYALSTSFGTISTPSQTVFNVVMDSDTLKQVKAQAITPQSNVMISLTYGDIQVR